MVLVGSVRIDLTDTGPDRWRNRLASIAVIPSGARLVLVVGPLKVEPEVARLLAAHVERITLEVQGEAHAVRRWLESIRAGGGLW